MLKGPTLYSINVKILPEFQQWFEGEEFTTEDFAWDNVRMIIYQEWADRIDGSFGLVSLYLNDAKEDKALDALEHLKTLNFVKSAEIIEEEFVSHKVGINIKSEFQQEFDNKAFVMSDFEWTNVESIEYPKPWVGGIIDSDSNPIPYDSRYIEVYFKKSGRNMVLDAIEHFKTLDFVESVNVCYATSID
ncbi:MAG: hypothetical protein AB7S44_04200 [Spirochaetales bacterium]